MASLFGVSSKGGFDITGGGQYAPWNWGISSYDRNAIQSALTGAEGTTQARYNQLGLGGSTMEGQDLGNVASTTGGLPQEANALLGGEQTANVGNPALNPALQSPINELLGATSTAQSSSALGQLAGTALGAAIGGAPGATVGGSIGKLA